MKKSMVKHSFIVTISVFSLILALPFFVGAKSVNAQNSTQSNPNGGGAPDSSLVAREAVVAKKLAGDNLKSCQNRENAVNNIMARVQDRAQKQLTLMTRMTERVQAFYVEKNMTLSNYDELVANVEAKKMASEQAMNSVRVMNGSFNCDNDPKGVATQFKSNARLQSGALGEYKNAIKDLIVAVKSAYNSSTEEN